MGGNPREGAVVGAPGAAPKWYLEVAAGSRAWVGTGSRSLVNARQRAVGRRLWKKRAERRGRALSRASPALSKALPRDAHFHSWISAWDLTDVTSARVL